MTVTVPFVQADASTEVQDSSWVRKTFLLDQSTLDANERYCAVFTNTLQNFEDTTLGGNICLNPFPQFTHYADPSLGSINLAHNPTNAGKQQTVHSLHDGLGMGMAYDEMYNQNRQMIHLQFGHIKFKGVLSFMLGMYDADAALLAKQGKTSLFYWLGKTALTLVTLPLQVLCIAAQAASFFFDRPTSQYAYLSPDMGTYWNRTTMMMNMFTTDMHITPALWRNSMTQRDRANNPIPDDVSGEDGADSADMVEYAYRISDKIFRKEGGIDMYLIGNKAQRMADARYKRLLELSEGVQSKDDWQAKLMAFVTNEKVKDPGGQGLREYLAKFHAKDNPFGGINRADTTDSAPAKTNNEDVTALNANAPAAAPATAPAAAPAAGAAPADGAPAAPEAPAITTKDTGAEQGFMSKFVQDAKGEWGLLKGWGSEGAEYLKADMHQGSQFICLRVDHTGSITDTFNSTTRESDLHNKLNSASKGFADMNFSFAGGNTGVGIIDAATHAVSEFAMGALDAVHLSGIAALFGAAYIDMPHHWDDSTASFPTNQYSFDCIPASGADLSRVIAMYVPAVLLLSAALPLSTGAQTYTAPYYCSVFDRGRCIIRLGIIDSLSLEWGTSTLGWNRDQKPLALKISFSVKDCSNIIHAPSTGSFDILKPWKNLFTDDTKFTDMVGMRSSLAMSEMIYPMQKLRLRMTTRALDYNSYFSRSHWSNAISSSQPMLILTSLFGSAPQANVRL